MINIFQPNITQESIHLLKNVFESNWLGRGKVVSEFESKLSAFLSIDKSKLTTMSCCSDAIFAIIKVLSDIDSRKTIIIPSISFPAVGSAVKASGLNLKIIDINPSNGNISLDHLKDAIDEDTLGIFCTHYAGIPVDTKQIREIVGDKIYILEDSACALGSFFEKNVSVGSFADFSCWSFDAMKLLVAGEGGAAYIKDEEIMKRFKEYLYLGLPAQDKSGLDKSGDDNNWWEYQLNDFGVRSVFTDINAAIALPQFKTLNRALQKKENIRKKYIESIKNNKFLSYSIQEGAFKYSNYFFTVLTEHRDNFARYMKGNGIYCTFRYYPLNEIDIFKDTSQIGLMDGTNIFASQALNIPIHHNLTDDNIERICESLASYGKLE